MTMQCTTCGAKWPEGRFGADCAECGGGALEIACPICKGKCGAVWRRAVADSNDAKTAHWFGRCALAGANNQSGAGTVK
jgi:hypothetical protein